MFKHLPMDLIVDRPDKFQNFFSQHIVAFVLLGVVVIAAIVIIVVAYRKSHKKGS